MKIRFAVNNLGSQGLRNLKVKLQERGHDALIIKHNKSRYIPKDTDIIINWGIPKVNIPFALNANSNNAVNKLKAFQLMVRNGLRYTTDIEVAKTFKLCYCRTLLSASQGRGIVVATSPNEIVEAPLYTKGIKSVKGEYRVHVFKNNIIDYAQKKKRNGVEEYNKYIRNYENGYIYARENVILPDNVISTSLEAVEDLGLDFGAVDVIVSGYSGKAFVLEVNTAPGLQGSTVEAYAKAIEELV